MARALWNGAVTFGLVHMPVALFAATRDSSIDFQWLDKRSLDPVGYKRYNKRTGRELKMQDIVKGVRQAGRYVVITDEEVRAAFPKSTQTIEIDSFVKQEALPLLLLERPYYLQPAAKAGRVYALLRETMHTAGVAGIARIVIHNKEHLAAVMVVDEALVLEVLRWDEDLRSAKSLDLPGRSETASLKAPELQMARRLVSEMTGPWKPQRYTEDFSKKISSLIRKKLAAGKAKQVEPLEQTPASARPSNVIDLAELLRRSMQERRAPAKAASSARRSPVRRAG